MYTYTYIGFNTSSVGVDSQDVVEIKSVCKHCMKHTHIPVYTHIYLYTHTYRHIYTHT